MINVRKLVLGSVASPEITPLPGSQHPAFETKLLDPLFSLNFMSDSAQDILWGGSRDMDQESSEEEDAQSDLKTLHLQLDSQQTPRKRRSTSSSVIIAAASADDLPPAPPVTVASRPKHLDTVEPSKNKPTVSFSAPNISSVPIDQSVRPANRTHGNKASGAAHVDDTVVSNIGPRGGKREKENLRRSSSEDSRTESEAENASDRSDRRSPPSRSSSSAAIPRTSSRSGLKVQSSENNPSGDGTPNISPHFPAAGDSPNESNTVLPYRSLRAHLQQTAPSTVTSPPGIVSPEPISSISMYKAASQESPSLPLATGISEQIAVSNFQKEKPQSVRSLSLKPTAPVDPPVSVLTSRLETSSIDTVNLFYQPKVFPRLFDAKGPIPKAPNAPVLPPLAIEKREKMIKSLSVPFFYTVSDDYIAVAQPSVPGAKIGDVHIHRNRLLDSVNIWILNQQEEWINCTKVWATKTTNPVRHPLYSSLILDTDGEHSWVPSYIKEATYRGRSVGRVGIMGRR